MDYIREFIQKHYDVKPGWQMRITTTIPINKRGLFTFLCYVGGELSNIFDHEEQNYFYHGETHIKIPKTDMAFIFKMYEPNYLSYFCAIGDAITGILKETTQILEQEEEMVSEEDLKLIMENYKARYPLVGYSQKVKEYYSQVTNPTGEKIKADLLSKNTLSYIWEGKQEIENVVFEVYQTRKPTTITFWWKAKVKIERKKYEILIEPFKGYIFRIYECNISH